MGLDPSPSSSRSSRHWRSERKARPWSKRPRPAPPGLVLGGITFAFGTLVMTQVMATAIWLGGRPSGVGDPDGESAMVMFAVLSGGAPLFRGARNLINRSAAMRPSRKADISALQVTRETVLGRAAVPAGRS